MTNFLAKKEQQLLTLLQREFPLISRPYLQLSRELDMAEEEVWQLVLKLKKAEIIRYLGPIFEAKAIGYHSALCALSLEESQLDSAVAIINQHPGVTHNYLRDDQYNIWFTLTIPCQEELLRHLKKIATRTDSIRYLYLPALRFFKIAMILDLDSKETKEEKTKTAKEIEPAKPLTAAAKEVIMASQSGFPLELEPYRLMAKQTSLGEEQFIDQLRQFKRQRVIRRLAALLKPQQAGFKSNVMVVWNVADQQAARVGEILAGEKVVTHCYQRARTKDWPYNLYSMAHFKEDAEIDSWLLKMQKKIGIDKFRRLKTLKEYKKIRTRFFLDDFSKYR